MVGSYPWYGPVRAAVTAWDIGWEVPLCSSEVFVVSTMNLQLLTTLVQTLGKTQLSKESSCTSVHQLCLRLPLWGTGGPLHLRLMPPQRYRIWRTIINKKQNKNNYYLLIIINYQLLTVNFFGDRLQNSLFMCVYIFNQSQFVLCIILQPV
jgi:hypothetical protein